MRDDWLPRLLGEHAAHTPLTPREARRERLTTAALVAGLLAYANGDAWRDAHRPHDLPTGSNFHLGILGLTLVWSLVERLPVRELGVGRQRLGRSLGWGLLVGLLASLPIRLFFAFPLVSRKAVTQPEYTDTSRGQLLWLLGVRFLLGSALFEEFAFRGLLHAKLVRLFGAGPALLVGSGVFAAWHLVITWYNLRRSNLPRVLFPVLYAGALTALFAGGLLFGLIRQATGHLAGSVLAHWLMVANIVLAVARPKGPGTA